MIACGAKSGRRFFCASVCALSLTLTLAACSTRSSPVAPADPDFALPASEIEIKWRAAVGALEFDFVDDGRICVGDGAGALAAVDLQSGAVEIFASGDLPELRHIACGDDLAFAAGDGAESPYLAAFAADGERWRVDLPERLVAPPVARAGRVFALAADSLSAFDAASGERLWRYRSPRAGWLSARVDAGIELADGVIYAGFRGGLLAAFAPATGDALWESTVADLPGGHEIDTALNIVKPAAVADAVCAAGFRAGFACATRAQGRVLWRRAGSTLLRAAAADDILFVVEENRGRGGALSARGAGEGDLLWRTSPPPGAAFMSPPAAAFGVVVVGDSAGRVLIYDARGGGLRAAAELDGARVVKAAPLADGDIVAQTAAGAVYRFVAR